MLAGYGCVDITPKMPTALCGFAARCNEPSEGIDAPIFIHSLAVEQDGQRVLMLVFDLLGLGVEVTEQIHASLDGPADLDIPRDNRIFCCTHTHSAPGVIKLIGCGAIEPAYVEQVIASAAEAAAQLSAIQRLS